MHTLRQLTSAVRTCNWYSGSSNLHSVLTLVGSLRRRTSSHRSWRRLGVSGTSLGTPFFWAFARFSLVWAGPSSGSRTNPCKKNYLRWILPSLAVEKPAGKTPSGSQNLFFTIPCFGYWLSEHINEVCKHKKRCLTFVIHLGLGRPANRHKRKHPTRACLWCAYLRKSYEGPNFGESLGTVADSCHQHYDLRDKSFCLGLKTPWFRLIKMNECYNCFKNKPIISNVKGLAPKKIRNYYLCF